VKYLKDKVVRGCLRGEKVICLCITEPYAGSDVANLKTEAKKTPDGRYYIVNGYECPVFFEFSKHKI
jgi:alkylation response protein AidB-like acyl-CoA dehydrogenase